MKHILFGALSLLFSTACALADEMKLAVTTSFHNSGLSEILLPEIKAELDIDVRLLSVGTGQALRLGQAGDVDAILVHSKAAEEAFIAEGFGVQRTEIMYNDFVIVGPDGDPAGIGSAANVVDAMQKIAENSEIFVSRGDDSGTHKKEIALWQQAGFDAFPGARWYRAVGAGMGASLNTASALNAYILTDRASWLTFGNKGNLKLLFEGDPALFNQYTFIAVNSNRHPHVNSDAAMRLERWLSSDSAKVLINGYRLNGEVLFTFNASTFVAN